MLLQLPQLLFPSRLEAIRQTLENAPWEPGLHSAGPQARSVKNNEQLPHDCPQAHFVQREILSALDQSHTFFSAALPLKVFTPRVNRYADSTNAYGPHVDNAVRLKPTSAGGVERIRTDLSCTVFLNSPEEYEGGELVIHDTYGHHQVKLQAGDAVLYPGTSLHEVRPVTQGQRLACFFWIQSLVRHSEQRRMLYALDTSIVDLRVKLGECQETVALTGVYHNLLRQWSET